MSKKPKSVKLVGTCPYCGEPVEMYITKKQIKALYKGFKLNIRKAQLETEKEVFKEGYDK